MLVDVHSTMIKNKISGGDKEKVVEKYEDRNIDESAQPQQDENVESRSRSAGDEALPGISGEPCGDLKC